MNEHAVRFLKFVFIAAPCVVVYFFSLIFFFLTLTGAEHLGIGRALLSICIAVASVFATTWACGFWGRWWFPMFFALLPLIIFADFLISATVGAPTLVIAAVSFVTLAAIRRGKGAKR